MSRGHLSETTFEQLHRWRDAAVALKLVDSHQRLAVALNMPLVSYEGIEKWELLQRVFRDYCKDPLLRSQLTKGKLNIHGSDPLSHISFIGLMLQNLT